MIFYDIFFVVNQTLVSDKSVNREFMKNFNMCQNFCFWAPNLFVLSFDIELECAVS